MFKHTVNKVHEPLSAITTNVYWAFGIDICWDQLALNEVPSTFIFPGRFFLEPILGLMNLGAVVDLFFSFCLKLWPLNWQQTELANLANGLPVYSTSWAVMKANGDSFKEVNLHETLLNAVDKSWLCRQVMTV